MDWPAPRLLLRAYRDAAVVDTAVVPLAPAAGLSAFGCDWKLDTSHGEGRLSLRLTLLAGSCPPVAAGVGWDLTRWSTDVYTLLPGALYAGNRLGCRPLRYSPRYPAADAGPDAPPLVTDLPRLRLEPDVRSRVQLLTGDLAMPAFACRWPDGATLLITAPAAPPDLLWEIAEADDRTAATLTLLRPGVRQQRYSFQGHIRTDHPSDDRARPLAVGESIELRFCSESFHTPHIPALFDRLFDFSAAACATPASRHPLPLSAAFDLVAAKRGREDYAADLRLFRTTNLGPGQTANIFQTGWCGGVIAESALLAAGPALAALARDSLTTFATCAPRPTGWLAGKAHADGTWTADFVHDPVRPWIHDWTLVRRQADALWYLVTAAERHTALHGEPPPDAWLACARGVADAFTVLNQTGPSPGQFIDIDTGQVRVGGSASGALAPAALCAAARLLHTPAYREVAAKLGAYYHDHYTARGVTTGGPADALQAPDSESAAALVESFLALHEAEVSGRPWLDYARDAAAQLASWVMPFDYPFPAESEFGRRDIPTTGSVFANVQNKHAAPGLCTHSGLSLLRLFRHTGDARLLHLVAAIARFLPWCVSRADQPICTPDGRALPPGWINERVNTSDWDHNVGGVFYGSTWSEVALLLTAVELPSVYAQPDTGVLAALDHVEVAWGDASRHTLRLHNPTAFTARVRVLAETAAEAARRPFGPTAALTLPGWELAPGASRELGVDSLRPAGR